MDNALYENALHVVPLLLIALFLDTHAPIDLTGAPRSTRWERAQDRLFVVLGFVAFMTSLAVVAGGVDGGEFTAGIVCAALAGAMGLLLSQIWRRLGTPDMSGRRVPVARPERSRVE